MLRGAHIYLMPMSKFSKLLFTIAAGALLCWWYQQQQPGRQTGPFIAFLDVGQGDASYIRTSSGADILIDGGPDRSILEQLPKVMQPGDDAIELILLTHPHADHLNGLIEVAKRYQVKQLVITSLPPTSSAYQELLQRLNAQQTEQLVVATGDQIRLDEQDVLKVLYPAAGEPLETLDTNDTSLVVEYHHHTATAEMITLFTGDAEAYAETAMMERDVLQDVDLLKVGHHGSNTSSSAAFLAIVQPELCVIEVGEGNSYGHPKPEILERLQPYCEIKRTDQAGNIVIDLN